MFLRTKPSGNRIYVQLVESVRKGSSVRQRVLGSVCLVADRGMISKATMAALEERGWSYILGCRMRATKEFREQVLAADAEPVLVLAERAGQEPQELAVREVILQDGDAGEGERRYVICRNAAQARRDQQARQEIVAKLQEQLKASAQALVGNRGFRRYLRTEGQGCQLDQDRIVAEERYDGLWALRVKAPLTATEAVLKYKQLWQVERCFREAKSLLQTRPVYHRRDETIRGHVFCSFLALVLKRELERRMREAGIEAEWADVVRDLDRLRETLVEAQGKRFALRTKAHGAVTDIVRCVGAKLPPVIQLVDSPDSAPVAKAVRSQQAT